MLGRAVLFDGDEQVVSQTQRKESSPMFRIKR